MAAVKLAAEIALYMGCEWSWLPGARPSSMSTFDTVRRSGINASLTTIVLLPVPLRPTVYQSSMTSMSSRGRSIQRRSGGPSTPSRLMGTAAVSQLQWSTPLEKKRSEEHTSELQSPDHLVCRLLLEKKNERHAAPCIDHVARSD